MAYNPQLWVDEGEVGETPMSADRFNHMEQGIAEGGLDEEALAATLANPESSASGAVTGLITEQLNGLSTAQIPYEHVIGSDLNAARPDWPGPVWWKTTVVGGDPVHRINGKDSVYEYVETAVTLASDDFTRADGALGNTPVGNKAWEVAGSAAGVTAAVVNNGLQFTAIATGQGYAVVNAGQANVDFTIRITATVTGYAGVAIRYIDPSNNLVLARVSGSDVSYRLVSKVGGTSTDIALLGVPMAAGDLVRVVCSDTTITIWINGTQRYTGTVAANASGTRFGAYLGNSATATRQGCRWDEFALVG